jgi:hypothetical protein
MFDEHKKKMKKLIFSFLKKNKSLPGENSPRK